MENRSNIIATILASTKLYLENMLDNSESSSDEENINYGLITKLQCKINPRRKETPRCVGYYETIIPRYLPEDFQRNFRLTPAAFEALCAQLIPIMREGYTTGRPLYKPEKKFLATIWLLATPDSYRYVINISVCNTYIFLTNYF